MLSRAVSELSRMHHRNTAYHDEPEYCSRPLRRCVDEMIIDNAAIQRRKRHAIALAEGGETLQIPGLQVF